MAGVSFLGHAWTEGDGRLPEVGTQADQPGELSLANEPLWERRDDCRIIRMGLLLAKRAGG